MVGIKVIQLLNLTITLSFGGTSNDTCEYTIVVLYTHMYAMIFDEIRLVLGCCSSLDLLWIALEKALLGIRNTFNMKEPWYL